jgi:hypothetical protein
LGEVKGPEEERSRWGDGGIGRWGEKDFIISGNQEPEDREIE